MKNAYDTIVEVRAVSGSKAKIAALRQGDSDELREVLQLALDPFRTYGVTAEKVDGEPIAISDAAFVVIMKKALDNLHRRDVTGHAARDAVLGFQKTSPPWLNDLFTCIVNKDLRAGLGISTVNKAFPDLIPEFKVMLAQPYVGARVKSWPVVVQPKLDGLRTIAIYDGGDTVTFHSREGHVFPALAHLSDAALAYINKLPSWELGIVLDGEVTSGDFLESVSKVRRKSEAAEDAVLHVFDWMPLDVFKERTTLWTCLKHRQAQLPWIWEGSVRTLDWNVAASDEQVLAMYDEDRAAGLEGVIVKDMNAPYDFKRSYAWMKIKDLQSVDLEIIGVEPGTGKYEGKIGALRVMNKGVEVKVGSGLTDELRGAAPEDLIGRMIEIEYHEETAYGSLRHPRFVRFRDGFSGSFE